VTQYQSETVPHDTYQVSISTKYIHYEVKYQMLSKVRNEIPSIVEGRNTIKIQNYLLDHLQVLSSLHCIFALH